MRTTRPVNYVPPNAPSEDGTALRCNDWDFMSPESTRLRYYYPQNITSLFVRSYDSRKTSGSLEVWEDDDLEEGQYEIQLQMRSRFGNGDGKQLDACLMKGSTSGEFGLGIYNVRGRNITCTSLSNMMSPGHQIEQDQVKVQARRR